ncbi:hypothetical protein [uncultured Litoreibacter sp.]|nr:hypothetical protein [uncultured Litoreibacter sp.]
MAGDNNTSLVEEWIRGTPDARAYSAHTMVGPLPQVGGVRIVPVMLLRDPISRIKSAYNFERNQLSESWGAKLAKAGSFQNYVETRLAQPGDRQCRNFHAHRLASIVPGPEPELHRAMTGLSVIAAQGVVGAVEKFDETIARLSARLGPDFPTLTWDETRKNVSKKNDAQDNLQLMQVLVDANRADLDLHSQVLKGFQ